MNDTLDMALKPIYLRAIRSGAKIWEYRDATPYWCEKLVKTESYKGMSVEDILDGLYCGSIEFSPRPWKYLLFHESGTQRTLKVECLEIVYFKSHRTFCIRLGKILE